MFRSKKLNLNGLELDGENPATPRTRAFCESKGMLLSYNNGYVSLTGNFSLQATEVAAFLASKQTTAPNSTATPTPEQETSQLSSLRPKQ